MENKIDNKNTQPWQHIHESRLRLLPEDWKFCSNEEAQMWLKIMMLSETDRYKRASSAQQNLFRRMMPYTLQSKSNKLIRKIENWG
jgi:hypothetical protein